MLPHSSLEGILPSMAKPKSSALSDGPDMEKGEATLTSTWEMTPNSVGHEEAKCNLGR